MQIDKPAQEQQRQQNLKTEIVDADAEINLQKRRLDSVKQTLKRYENLTQQHFVSDVALQARRDHCDAMLCAMSAAEVVRLTRMGKFAMDGSQSGPMALL